MNKLEVFLNTPDDSDIGYFVEVDLRHPDNKRDKPKNFPFCPDNKLFPKEQYNDYMNKIKPKNYTKSKKVNM